jgi:hypothetical protein
MTHGSGLLREGSGLSRRRMLGGLAGAGSLGLLAACRPRPPASI